MGKIFISYRRADSMETTGRIYDRLVRAFGRKNVIKDVDNIPPGANFREYIDNALRLCETVLVVIGDRWLAADGSDGRPRLFEEKDFVRMEIEAAFRNQAHVLPILIRKMEMPKQEALPKSIQALADIHATRVRPDPDFNHDMDHVIRAIGKSRGKLLYGILAAAVLALATIGVLGLKGWLPFRHAPSSEPTTALPISSRPGSSAGADASGPGEPVRGTGDSEPADAAVLDTLAQETLPPPAIPAVEPGALSIDSRPRNAAVRLGRQPLGETPLDGVRVEPGRYLLVVSLPGYESESRDIVVHPGQDAQLSIDLAQRTYPLTVATQPDDATVLLGSEHMGQSPCSFAGLTEGSYPIEIRKAGYRVMRDTIAIGPGHASRFDTALELQTSRLRIQVVPSGLIYVDGDRKTGDTNAPYVATVVPGTYEVMATHLSWGRWIKQVEVGADELREVIFDFSREIAVTVISPPPHAAIIVNGVPTGRYTPSVLHLRPGERNIEVARDGYRSRQGTRRLMLEAPLSDPIEFELVRFN